LLVERAFVGGHGVAVLQDGAKRRQVVVGQFTQVETSCAQDHQASFFCQAPAYEAGTKPIASLMSSIGRFSSALNVVIRGEPGAMPRQRRMLAHFTICPSRCPRCSLSTSVQYW